MTHDDGRDTPTGAPVHAVDVRTADPAGLHRDENLVFGDFGFGDIAKFELVVSGESEGFHSVGKLGLEGNE